MKRKILAYLLSGFFVVLLGFGGLIGSTVSATGECNGIKLNTNFPIIGDCIHLKNGEKGVDATTVLPYMVGSLMKIIMSIIMLVCFIMIIIGGIMWASGNKGGKGKEMIKKVAITILLLGLSGVILKVINPMFFS